GYILGGKSYSGISGDKTQESQGGYDYWIVKTDGPGCSPCPLPQSVYISNLTASTATVNWTGNDCATGYRIRKRPVGTSTWIYSSVAAPTTSKTLQNNLEGITYEVQVQTFCNAEKTDSSGYTASVYFFTPCSSCPLPQTVFISNITATTADVNWTGNSCAASYRIRKRPVGTSTWIYSSVTAPTTSKTLQNNLEGTTYEVQVQTYCNTEKTDSSGYTSSVNFTSPVICNGVNGAATADVTASSANLNWTYSASPTKWIINYRPLSTSTWTSVTIDGSNSNYLLSGLTSSTSYKWKIRAKCGSIKSSWSAVQNFKTTALKLSDQNTLSEDVLIYPNPNHGSFSITIKNCADSDVTIDVLNLLGQVVQHIPKQTINNESSEQINLEPTAAGVYFVKIQQGNETIVKKVVVEK
ncbi:MAG: fibronectin type III domain-containing protein, partial [Chitinophagales bacterium]